MKIVLDTNVFISGIFFSGPPSIILQAWRDSKIKIILSKEILGGNINVLRKNYHLNFLQLILIE